MPSVEMTSASFGTSRLTDLADRGDPLVVDQDDAIGERWTAEAVNQPAADKRGRAGGDGERECAD